MRHPHDRGARRNERDRAKRRAYRRIKYLWGWKEIPPRFVGLLARTPVMCSCSMCGYARHWGGPTLEEVTDTISRSIKDAA